MGSLKMEYTIELMGHTFHRHKYIIVTVTIDAYYVQHLHFFFNNWIVGS